MIKEDGSQATGLEKLPWIKTDARRGNQSVEVVKHVADRASCSRPVALEWKETDLASVIAVDDCDFDIPPLFVHNAGKFGAVEWAGEKLVGSLHAGPVCRVRAGQLICLDMLDAHALDLAILRLGQVCRRATSRAAGRECTWNAITAMQRTEAAVCSVSLV